MEQIILVEVLVEVVETASLHKRGDTTKNAPQVPSRGGYRPSARAYGASYNGSVGHCPTFT